MILEDLISSQDLNSYEGREALLSALEEKTESERGNPHRHIWCLLHDALHWSTQWPSKQDILELVDLAQRVDYPTMKVALLRNGLRLWPPIDGLLARERVGVSENP